VYVYDIRVYFTNMLCERFPDASVAIQARVYQTKAEFPHKPSTVITPDDSCPPKNFPISPEGAQKLFVIVFLK